MHKLDRLFRYRLLYEDYRLLYYFLCALGAGHSCLGFDLWHRGKSDV